MKFRITILSICTAFAASLALSVGVRAQQPRSPTTSRNVAYNPRNETILQGTVLAYTENSSLPLRGAHATVQTPAGAVDVHLGPASYLRANHFSLAPGESIRVVGALSRQGKDTVFLARAAQSTGRTIAIRSTRGFLLARSAPRAMSKELRAQTQEVGPR